VIRFVVYWRSRFGVQPVIFVWSRLN